MQKEAASLIARGYSKITAAHVLGIRKGLIEDWMVRQEFRKEISNKEGDYAVRRF